MKTSVIAVASIVLIGLFALAMGQVVAKHTHPAIAARGAVRARTVDPGLTETATRLCQLAFRQRLNVLRPGSTFEFPYGASVSPLGSGRYTVLMQALAYSGGKAYEIAETNCDIAQIGDRLFVERTVGW